MEEKERYVYHEVSNEVEQYECYYDTEKCCELFDNEDILNRLNKQDKRIKELEEMQKAYKEISYNETLQTFELNNIKSENAQLNQQLHDLPNKIVEDIKIQMGSIEDILINCGNGKEDALCWFNECLDSILKKYGGE